MDKALGTIPSVDHIIEDAIAHLRRTGGFSREDIIKDFGVALVNLERTAYGIYTEHEKKALDKLIDMHMSSVSDEDTVTRETLRSVLTKVTPDIKDFEFRAGQSRKARGGSTWEKIGPALLDTMGVPSEKPTGKDARRFNQIDRIVPSVTVAKKKPEQAIYLSFKRTTRERWRVLVNEGRLGFLYLVTQGKDITESKLKEMEARRIIAYVPQKIKEQSRVFHESNHVRPFNDLPRDLQRSL